MREKLLKWLPWKALGAGVLTVTFLIVLTVLHSGLRKENTENRQAAVDTLKKIQALYPEDMRDPIFKSKIGEALYSPEIATIWLISLEGEILFSRGSTARSAAAGSVDELATAETKDILSSLPENALDAYQRTLLLAASAIQREGSHNDIYNHLVEEIHSPDGSKIGFIGVAYELSSEPDQTSTLWIISVLVVLLNLPAYWFSLPLWVFLDARRRGERAWLWAAFVSIGNLVALIGYLLARQPADNSPLPVNKE